MDKQEIVLQQMEAVPTVHGMVQLFRWRKNAQGVLVPYDEICLENAVVANLRYRIAGLISGNFWHLSNAYIAAIGFGIDGTAEAYTDEDITDPPSGAYRQALTNVDYPTLASVRFKARLEPSEGNGIIFREVGLLFSGTIPPLAARKAFADMTKSEIWQWDIWWVLSWD